MYIYIYVDRCIYIYTYVYTYRRTYRAYKVSGFGVSGPFAYMTEIQKTSTELWMVFGV